MEPPIQKQKRERKLNRRYYLHLKLRHNRIKYDPHSKSIELSVNVNEDTSMMRQKEEKVMQYVNELLVTHNYIIEKVIMKATKEKEEVIPASTELLVKTEEIARQFPKIQDKIEQYNKYSLSIKIEDEDTLMVAENTSSEIHEVFKNVDKVRKAFKDPYFATAKAIDEYAKTILEPLEKAKRRVNDEIANYRTVQAAMIKAQEEKEKERIRLLEEKKKEELAKLQRIEQQLNARIYGGLWTAKSGEKYNSLGCFNESDCDNLLTMIAERVPTSESYEFFGNQHEEMISNVKKRLAEHRINLHNLNGDSRLLREDAMIKIANAKLAADVTSSEVKESIEKKIERETIKEERTFEKSIDAARKGVKKVLKFIVTEPVVVPREFWTIDEEKLRSFMNTNNESIRNDLLNNKETLPGVKFYIDDTYCSR